MGDVRPSFDTWVSEATSRPGRLNGLVIGEPQRARQLNVRRSQSQKETEDHRDFFWVSPVNSSPPSANLLQYVYPSLVGHDNVEPFIAVHVGHRELRGLTDAQVDQVRDELGRLALLSFQLEPIEHDRLKFPGIVAWACDALCDSLLQVV